MTGCFTRCLWSQREFTPWKAGVQEASSSWSCHLDKNTWHWLLVGFPSLCSEILYWGAYSSISVISLFFSGPLKHGFLQVLFGYYICCLVDPAEGIDPFLDHVVFICVAQEMPAYASWTDSWMSEGVYVSLSSLSHSQHLSSPTYHTATTNSRPKSLLLTFPLLATWAAFLQHLHDPMASTFHTWMHLSGVSSRVLATVSFMVWLVDISQFYGSVCQWHY